MFPTCLSLLGRLECFSNSCFVDGECFTTEWCVLECVFFCIQMPANVSIDIARACCKAGRRCNLEALVAVVWLSYLLLFHPQCFIWLGRHVFSQHFFGFGLSNQEPSGQLYLCALSWSQRSENQSKKDNPTTYGNPAMVSCVKAM